MPTAQAERSINRLNGIFTKMQRRNIIIGFEHLRAKAEAAGMQRLDNNDFSDSSSLFNIHDNDISLSYNANLTMISDISKKNSLQKTMNGLKETNPFENTQSDYLKNYLEYQNEETKQIMEKALKLGANDELQDEFINKMKDREEEIMSVESQNFDDVSAYAEERNSKLDIDIEQIEEQQPKPDKSLTRTDYIQKKDKRNCNKGLADGDKKLGQSAIGHMNLRQTSGSGFVRQPVNVNQNLQASLVDSEIEMEEEDSGLKPKRFSEVMNNSVLRNEALDMLSGGNRNNNDMLASMVTHKNTAINQRTQGHPNNLLDAQEIPEEDESVSINYSQTARNGPSNRYMGSKRQHQNVELDDSYNESNNSLPRSAFAYLDQSSQFNQERAKQPNQENSDIAVVDEHSNNNSQEIRIRQFKSMEQEHNLDSPSLSVSEPKSQLRDSRLDPYSSNAQRLNKSTETKRDEQAHYNSALNEAVKESKVNYSSNYIKRQSDTTDMPKRETVDSMNSLAKRLSIKESEIEDETYLSGAKRLSDKQKGFAGLAKRNTKDETANRDSLHPFKEELPDPNLLLQMSKKQINFNLDSNRSLEQDNPPAQDMIDEHSMESDTDSSFYAQNQIKGNKDNFDNNHSALISYEGNSQNYNNNNRAGNKGSQSVDPQKVQKEADNITSREQSVRKVDESDHYDPIDESELYINKKSKNQAMPAKFSFATPVALEEIGQPLHTNRESKAGYQQPMGSDATGKGFGSFRGSFQPYRDTLKSMNETGDDDKMRKLFESEFNDMDEYSFNRLSNFNNEFNTFKNDFQGQFFNTRDSKLRSSLVNSDNRSVKSDQNVFDDEKTCSVTEKSNDIFSYKKNEGTNRHEYDTQNFNSPNLHLSSEANGSISGRKSTEPRKMEENKHRFRTGSRPDVDDKTLKGSEVEELDVQEWIRQSQIDVPVIHKDDETEEERSPLNPGGKHRKSHFAEYNGPKDTGAISTSDGKPKEDSGLLSRGNRREHNSLFDIAETIELADSDICLKRSTVTDEIDNPQESLKLKESKVDNQQKKEAQFDPYEQTTFNKTNTALDNFSSFNINACNKPTGKQHLSGSNDFADKITALESKLAKLRTKALLKPFLIISMLKLFRIDSRISVLFSVLSKLVQLKTRTAYDVVYKYCVEYYKAVYQVQQIAKKLKRRSLIASLKRLALYKPRSHERRKIRKNELKIFIATFEHIKRNQIYDCFVKIQFLNNTSSPYMSMADPRSVGFETKTNSKELNASQYYNTLKEKNEMLIKIKDLNDDSDDELDKLKRSISPADKKPGNSKRNLLNISEGNFFDYISRAQSNAPKEDEVNARQRKSFAQGHNRFNKQFVSSYDPLNHDRVYNQLAYNTQSRAYPYNNTTEQLRRVAAADANSYYNNPVTSQSAGFKDKAYNKGKQDLIMKTLSQINTQLKRLNSEQANDEDHLEEYILEKLMHILELLANLENKVKNGAAIDKQEIQDIYQTLSVLIEHLALYSKDDPENSKYMAYLDILQENMRFVDSIKKRLPLNDTPALVTTSNQFKFKHLTHMLQNLTNDISRRNSGNSPSRKKAKRYSIKAKGLVMSSINPPTNNAHKPDIYKSDILQSAYKGVSTAENLLIFLNFLTIRKKKAYGKVIYSRIKLKAIEIEKASKARKRLHRLVALVRVQPLRELKHWKREKNRLLVSLWRKTVDCYQLRLNKGFQKLAENNRKDEISKIPRSSLRSLIENSNMTLDNANQSNALRDSAMKAEVRKPNKLRKSIGPSKGNMMVKDTDEDFFYLNLEENYMQKVSQNKSLNMSLNKSMSKHSNL